MSNLPEPKRQRFIFALDENCNSLRQPDGSLLVGHRFPMWDLPMDQPGDNFLVIANSLTRTIFGLFRQASPQRLIDPPLILSRKVWASTETYTVECPYVFNVEPEPSDLVITRGLSWEKVAEIIDVPTESWKALRKLKITDSNFEKLCAILRNIQDPGVEFEGAVDLPHAIVTSGIVNFPTERVERQICVVADDQNEEYNLNDPFDDDPWTGDDGNPVDPLAVELFGGSNQALGDFVEYLGDDK